MAMRISRLAGLWLLAWLCLLPLAARAQGVNRALLVGLSLIHI